MRSAILLISATLAFAQQTEPPKTTFEEQPAFVLANGAIELTVFPKGSTLANLVLADDPEKISPLWNPARMARESGQKKDFGDAFGHFVCVDGFGPVSPEEQAAGLPGHGEAHIQPFTVKFFAKEGRNTTLTLGAHLPLTQENFTRTLRMVEGENVVYVESQLESLAGFDRPAFWAEHATIGSPFLEAGVTVVDMPAHRAKTRPYQPGATELPHRLPSDKEFTWPNAPTVSGRKVDLRAAPAPPNSGDHTTCLLDPARKLVFVTALHPGKHLMLGYLFKQQEFPWIQNWEYYPPSGKLARGMEISTQPFDVPRREVVQLNSLFGSPVYRWLPAKSKIEARFLMFYARTPEGFQKVDDVRLEGGRIIVEDRKARKQVTLNASLPL
jgi:hypothetical protein